MPQQTIPRMKTIGVIGGLGPQSTLDILDRLHKVCQKRIPQMANSGYPRLYVGFCHEAPMAINADGSMRDPLAPSSELLDVARAIGAITDFLIIASNTPHLFASEIEEVSGRVVLSIVDAVVEEIRKRGSKNVGIIAVGEALRQGMYQRALDAQGIKWVAIPLDVSKALDMSIFAIMEGDDPAALSRPAEDAVAYLRAQKVDGIILGCTEIPLLLGSACDERDIINPSQLLAEVAVRYAIEP